MEQTILVIRPGFQFRFVLPSNEDDLTLGVKRARLFEGVTFSRFATRSPFAFRMYIKSLRSFVLRNCLR